MELSEWIEIGVSSGFCAPPVCDTHDGATMTAEEKQAFEDGQDPCIPIVRLWSEGAPAE
jgi:hypothetical protein